MAILRPPKAPPLTVGRYALAGKIGVGGMGPVYRGRDVDNDSLVTVYLLNPEWNDDSKTIQRLRDEYRSACQYEHPNILRLMDLGQDGGFWYLVTEWVEGISLAHMIEAHSRLPEETAVRIVTQVGQAVDYAHTVGYSHCRVRPTSVVIRNDGVAKLIAFKPAIRTINEKGDQRKPGGDPAAPESSLFAQNLTFSEVVRSLGATLYQSVTGLAWIDPGPPPPPGTKRPRSRSSRSRPRPMGLSERVELAVRWATDYDPIKQPISCAEWLKLLRSKSRTAATARADARPAGAEADDRRASVRYAVGVGSSCTINTSVFGNPVEKPDSEAVWPLVVRDVSSGGVGILLARRCEPGTELLIELISESNQVTRSLPVKVVRVRRDTIGHWVHGCEFFTPLDQSGLNAVLGYLGRVDPS
jgi:serine/threonine protein kinase